MINQLPINPEPTAFAYADRDLKLVQRLCADDATALDELLSLYWSAVAAYAERLLGNVDAAEDVAQKTFLQLWQRRSSWRVGGSVRSYLYRVARNLALNEQRRRTVRAKWGEIFRRQEQGRPARPDQVAEGNELEAAVNVAISALPERRREVFELVRFHNVSYREVGDIMGISPQTVANQMSAALTDLRNSLAPFLEEPASAPLRLLPRSAPIKAAISAPSG
jgi:RNA polymerase sigma-70 factor (ECF subfamily)